MYSKYLYPDPQIVLLSMARSNQFVIINPAIDVSKVWNTIVIFLSSCNTAGQSYFIVKLLSTIFIIKHQNYLEHFMH